MAMLMRLSRYSRLARKFPAADVREAPPRCNPFHARHIAGLRANSACGQKGRAPRSSWFGKPSEPGNRFYFVEARVGRCRVADEWQIKLGAQMALQPPATAETRVRVLRCL